MLMLLCCGFDILNKLLIAIVLGILFYWRSKCSLKTELPWVLWILQVMMVLLTLAYLENGTLRLFPYDLILLLPMSYGLLKQSARFANPIKTEDLPQHVRLHLKVQPL
jgi:hypothetical protein